MKKKQEESHEGHHIIVQHHYHDHAEDSPDLYNPQQHPARGGVVTPFPLKLHAILTEIENEGLSHIVSWQPHGRCFAVHKPSEFTKLLPKYFKLSKLASFQRQLNLYGFQRLTRGRDRGGYYHELFLRSKHYMAHNIHRTKVKGTGIRAKSNPDQEPNFYSMPWVVPQNATNESIRSPFVPWSMSNCPTREASAPRTLLAQLPLSSSESKISSQRIARRRDDDIVCAFGDRTFHYLDPYQLAQKASQTKSEPQEAVQSSDAESFFKNFYFPDNIGVEIEDDDVFGAMLERMIFS